MRRSASAPAAWPAPRTTTRGRPWEHPEGTRADGYNAAVVANLLARLGRRKVSGLIRSWQRGTPNTVIARRYCVDESVIRRWRKAFGVTTERWVPFSDVAALLPGLPDSPRIDPT